MASRIRFRADEMLILRVALFRTDPGESSGCFCDACAGAAATRPSRSNASGRQTVSAVRRALVSSSVYRQDVISRSRSRNMRGLVTLTRVLGSQVANLAVLAGTPAHHHDLSALATPHPG